jgi:excisionase family DNA binding protein
VTANTNDVAALVAQLSRLLATEGQHGPSVPDQRTTPVRVLLTAEEAAERLGIGRTLMYQLIRTGEVESVLIGRLRRIPASAVDEYAQRLVAQQLRPNAA